jgi:hypothetical protein
MSFKGIVVLLATLQGTSPTMTLETSEMVSKKCSPNLEGGHTILHEPCQTLGRFLTTSKRIEPNMHVLKPNFECGVYFQNNEKIMVIEVSMIS